MRPLDDQIAAIATPPGYSGLAVIRVSGAGCVETVSHYFKPASALTNALTHTIHYGHLFNESGDMLDEVMVSVFYPPKTYTGQESVEISCHGGPVITQAILNALINSKQIRLADPGEFTKRAYLLGRIDLTQAESVADLIHSTSILAQKASLFQLSGKYSDKLKQIRDELIDFISLLELELDFSDEDVEFASRPQLVKKIEQILAYVGILTDSFRQGRFIRDGAKIVIAGKPNAGKSTLLNTLLGHDRAIVSEIEGTTRDTIEEQLNIDGVPFKIIDTAGIRETTEVIEKIGVSRTFENIKKADILIYIYDANLGLSDYENQLISQLKNENPDLHVLIAANKSDLLAHQSKPDVDGHLIMSAKNEWGMDQLKNHLISVVNKNSGMTEARESVTNVRHYQALLNVMDRLSEAKQGVDRNISPDFISADIRSAIHEIGVITGETTTEDILNHIFSKFCIGK